MELTTWVGICGTVLAFLLFLPQARRAWANRHRPERLDGISIAGQTLIVANAVVWGLYAVLADAFWTGAPGLVNAPLALCTIFLLQRSRHRHKTNRQGCVVCSAGVEHEVFITNPAGFGSIMGCTPATREHGVPIFSTEDARILRTLRL